jgi:hypothetical protein
MIYVATFIASFAVGRYGCMSRYALVRIPAVLLFFAGMLVSSLMFFKTVILGI